MAAVALAHQVNDNLLRAWVRSATGTNKLSPSKSPSEAEPRFVPVRLAAPMEPPPFVRIHIQHGNTQIHLEWPLASIGACSEWLRGFLR